jgi:catechol 2,3-dioxygenase-like lactoylglutathione lyase family enzyme/predicted enzyme related to lactoylglutathione lyase
MQPHWRANPDWSRISDRIIARRKSRSGQERLTMHTLASPLVRGLRVTALLAGLAPGIALPQSEFTHAHLRVPADRQAEAAEWYHTVLGGEPGALGPGPGIRHHNGFVGTMRNEGMAADGAGSVIDHVGISVPDVRAAAELARTLGGEIRTAPQSGVTAPLIAQITDPWGGRFELLEVPEQVGINHIHFYASDADAMRDWFLEVFGGERDETRGQGRFHSILYDSVWILITQAADDDRRAPSRLRATDHIGFRVPSLAAFRAQLIASGYEPYLERPNPPGADLLFFEGPDGIHFEITEPAPR